MVPCMLGVLVPLLMSTCGTKAALQPTARTQVRGSPVAHRLLQGSVTVSTANVTRDLEVVRGRLYASAMAGCNNQCGAAQGFSASLQPDGSWKDVNYTDQDRSEWKTSEHWTRLLVMGVALRCSTCSDNAPIIKVALRCSTCSDNAAPHQGLLGSIKLALGYWVAKDFLNPNWWYNDFGVPMSVAPFGTVMAGTPASNVNATGSLTPEEFGQVEALVLRGTDPMWEPHGRPHGPHYTGENLVWSLQLDIQRGVLTNNRTLVMGSFSKMWSSLQIEPQGGDGLMEDGSFHQHGALLQSASYGSALMLDILGFATLSGSTSFAIPHAPLTVLANYLVNGQQYMIHGSGATAVWLVPPRGREIVRAVATSCGSPSAPFPSTEVANGLRTLLSAPNPPMAAGLKAFEQRLRAGASVVSPTQTRHFPESDYTTHHRAGFSTDVRTWSNRTLNAECVNAENQLGGHMADGAAFTYVTGSEYTRIFPVWDWRKIPGVLATEGIFDTACDYESRGRTSFVGGAHVNPVLTPATDRGHVGGVVGMDFARGAKQTHATSTAQQKFDTRTSMPSPAHTPPAQHDANEHLLTAKRAWFLLDNGFIALVANVSYDGPSAAAASAGTATAVTVALEQNNLAGAVLTGVMPGSQSPPSRVPDGNSSWPLQMHAMPEAVAAAASKGNMPAQATEARSYVTSNKDSTRSGRLVGRWITHRNTTYVALSSPVPVHEDGVLGNGIFVSPSPTLRAALGEQTGSWQRISSSESPAKVTLPVFKLWLDLGAAPVRGTSAAYAVLPNVPNGAKAADALAGVAILANTAARQVVIATAADGKSQAIMAVAYSSGVLLTGSEAVGSGLDLRTNSSIILTVEMVGSFVPPLLRRHRATMGTEGHTYHDHGTASSVNFYFSHPTLVGGTVRLETNTLVLSGGRGAVKCGPAHSAQFPGSSGTTVIELELPALSGTTALGSCIVAG